MFWLRSVAIVGLSLEILYFLLSGGDLRTGIGWDLVFIAINAYQLSRLMQDRLSLRLPKADRELLRSVLTGLDNSQIARLLVAGRFSDIAKDTTLAEENKPLHTLFFICAGHLKVTIAGREVAHLEKGNFVGEVAFLTESLPQQPWLLRTACERLSLGEPSSASSSVMKRKSQALSISFWDANSHTRSRSATPCSYGS